MTEYVLGFAFNSDKDYVVLINKNKPNWQKGSLNGVGGKIETGETEGNAMVREFYEETGVKTKSFEWAFVGKMKGEDWECSIFTMFKDCLMEARTTTDEQVSVFPVSEILKGDYKTISNIPFLIELCRDAHRPTIVNINY
jgi:8-oxo-dGTP diphosphatase